MNTVDSTVAAIASDAKLRRAEVADDRGVDKRTYSGSGGERAERRHREQQDLAVVPRTAASPTLNLSSLSGLP